jgi:hypothetical protein
MTAAAETVAPPPKVADPPLAGSFAGDLRRHAPRAAGWVLPFVLMVYLGMEGGGYNEIVRNEVGIAVWWIVLVGVAVGVLPSFGLGRWGWVAVALLGGFAAWTTLGIAWSESSERSLIEASRVATYLGVFVLALSIRRPDGLRRTVSGLAAGLTVIATVALMSRLHPSWFPSDETGAFLNTQQKRLSYPVNYWNGLAALMAMAIPLLLGTAIQARTIAGRALAAAAVPAVALTAFFTLSRGGAIETAVALGVFLILAPRRLVALPVIGLATAGSAVLIAAAAERKALTDGLGTAGAHHQGNEVLVITLVVCGLVALLQAGAVLAERRGLAPRIEVPRQTAIGLAGVVAVVAMIAAIAAGLPRSLSDQWNEFKSPVGAGAGVSRFESSSGGGRYQTWSAAIDANKTAHIIGIGPGTYEFWWAEHGDIPAFVRDAHSLYLETLGELGLVGFALIVGFVVLVLVNGAGRSLEGDPDRRWSFAAATASAAAFAAAAAIDWAWELSVLPVVFMLLAGGILSPRRYRTERKRSSSSSRHRHRSARHTRSWRVRVTPQVILALLSVLALILIAIPLRGASALRTSQDRARAGDLQGALDAAHTAHDRQPYAASPPLQEALVLELMGDFDAAASAAQDATRAESTNWRTWLVLSRVETERGDPGAAATAYRRARALNPRSPLFAQS